MTELRVSCVCGEDQTGVYEHGKCMGRSETQAELERLRKDNEQLRSDLRRANREIDAYLNFRDVD